ncbi:hypothetical protein L7A40_31490, partial [Achromobacter xylosoxidans]|uniref:hypothetical protein n=1 Tax=Alcaligenes xylosoxydans xylosoxydans TaxID=85698 RepID=UPI001F0F312D
MSELFVVCEGSVHLGRNNCRSRHDAGRHQASLLGAGDQALLSAVDAHFCIQPAHRLAHLLGGAL